MKIKRPRKPPAEAPLRPRVNLRDRLVDDESAAEFVRRILRAQASAEEREQKERNNGQPENAGGD